MGTVFGSSESIQGLRCRDMQESEFPKTVPKRSLVSTEGRAYRIRVGRTAYSFPCIVRMVTGGETDKAACALPEEVADAKGFEPPTSASGGHRVDPTNPDLQRVLASTTWPGRASKGTQEAVLGHGVPKEIVELAQRILDDEESNPRALELAAWVLKTGCTK